MEHPQLSDAEVDRIAERISEKMMERAYAEIGKSIIRKVLWTLGVGAAGVSFYLTSKGAGH